MARFPPMLLLCAALLHAACTSTPRAAAPPDADGSTLADAGVDGRSDVPDSTAPDASASRDADEADVPLPPCQDLKGVVTTITKGVYCVTGDVIVPKGALLDIPAGTEFIVMGRFHFGRDPALPDDDTAITGGIRAIGTASEPIVFRGATKSTGWFGLAVSHNPDPVHLEYVTIRDTYKDDHSPVNRIWRRGGGLSSYVNVKGTILRHCQFINNRAWMVAGALDVNGNGEYPNTALLEITDSLFEDNVCECGTYDGSTDDKCGGGAIRFSHNVPPIKIERNVFRNNRALRTAAIDAYGGALGGFDSLVPIGKNNQFLGNSAQAHDGAISCAGHPQLGFNFASVDSSNTFTGNTPDNGCGL